MVLVVTDGFQPCTMPTPTSPSSARTPSSHESWINTQSSPRRANIHPRITKLLHRTKTAKQQSRAAGRGFRVGRGSIVPAVPGLCPGTGSWCNTGAGNAPPHPFRSDTSGGTIKARRSTGRCWYRRQRRRRGRTTGPSSTRAWRLRMRRCRMRISPGARTAT